MMDTTPKDMTHLFAQLGLPCEPEAITHFFASHRLGAGQKLEDAPFWRGAQRAFIMEEMRQDSEWSETIESLDAGLRK
ncbi:DUF2789 domain-containing protein [Ferrimonas pelagia]|uniref:DUF2789 domain-containing protein n=1 Tax=Ferrimonas pelagia TaxID=1177826 RepID=A0ABP9EG11_9GAMM